VEIRIVCSTDAPAEPPGPCGPVAGPVTSPPLARRGTCRAVAPRPDARRWAEACAARCELVTPACGRKPPWCTVTGMPEQFCPRFDAEGLPAASCEVAKTAGTVNGLLQVLPSSLVPHLLHCYRFDLICSSLTRAARTDPGVRVPGALDRIHQPRWLSGRGGARPGCLHQPPSPIEATVPPRSGSGGQPCPGMGTHPRYLDRQSRVSHMVHEVMRREHEGVSP
jgi:hypothetical protein